MDPDKIIGQDVSVNTSAVLQQIERNTRPENEPPKFFRHVINPTSSTGVQDVGFEQEYTFVRLVPNEFDINMYIGPNRRYYLASASATKGLEIELPMGIRYLTIEWRSWVSGSIDLLFCNKPLKVREY